MKNIFINLISFYQRHISKYIRNRCRFYPSCSEYTKQAIDKYGIIRGIFKGFLRILRCNPLFKGGVEKID